MAGIVTLIWFLFLLSLIESPDGGGHYIFVNDYSVSQLLSEWMTELSSAATNPHKYQVDNDGMMTQSRYGLSDWIRVTRRNHDSSLQISTTDDPRYISFLIVKEALVPVYNSWLINEGDQALSFTEEAMSGIFDGSITHWNSPLITDTNPSLQSVRQPIQIIQLREDGGGSIQRQKAASDMKWTRNKQRVIESDGIDVQGGIVDSLRNSIALMPISHLDQQRSASETKPFSISSGPNKWRDVRLAAIVYKNGTMKEDYFRTRRVYLTIDRQTVNCTRFRRFRSALESLFENFHDQTTTTTTLGGLLLNVTRDLGFIPVSARNISQNIVILKDWSCGRQSSRTPGDSNGGSNGDNSFIDILIVPLAILGIILVGLGTVQTWRYRLDQTAAHSSWLIPLNQVRFGLPVAIINSESVLQSIKSGLNIAKPPFKGKIVGRFNKENASEDGISGKSSSGSQREMIKEDVTPKFFGTYPGRFTERPILLFQSGSGKSPTSYNKKTIKRIQHLIQTIHHENIWKLFGVVWDDGCLYFVHGMGTKGCLHNLLAHSRYELDINIKYNLAEDVADAMKYLHLHGILHGFLDTWNCILDDKWTVKVGNWSQLVVAELEKDRMSAMTTRPMLNKFNRQTDFQRLLFRHADLLCGSLQDRSLETRHDLYSMAMVFIEIFTRELPYAESAILMPWKEILQKVSKTAMPPNIQPSIPAPMKYIIQNIIRDKPLLNANDVAKRLHGNKPNQKGIVDTLMVAMEDYMNSLEEKVEERTGELRAVSKKMEELIHRMLPKEVAIRLQNGLTIEPQYYESVSIYFSDIVSFTALCSESSPLDVIRLLNALYTLFDTIIEQYNVYKVETIGDAYMCVSGLPRPLTDGQHAEQIARMSLDVVAGVQKFRVPHFPNRRLAIRVGLHSGSVMAGVVGLKMPRYCLFGDTVNTASRMESNSAANCIQASEDTAAILHQKFPEFIVEERGEIELKGKGMTKTFWIKGIRGEDGGDSGKVGKKESVVEDMPVFSPKKPINNINPNNITTSNPANNDGQQPKQRTTANMTTTTNISNSTGKSPTFKPRTTETLPSVDG